MYELCLTHDRVRTALVHVAVEGAGKNGSTTFISPRTFLPEKNANNVVEIEAGMIKQYLSSRNWIEEAIRC